MKLNPLELVLHGTPSKSIVIIPDHYCIAQYSAMFVLDNFVCKLYTQYFEILDNKIIDLVSTVPVAMYDSQ